MTTLLAGWCNSVLDSNQILSPLLEDNVIILSIKCSLGSMHNSPITRDVGCWKFTSSSHLESLWFLIIAFRRTTADAAASTGSGGACLSPDITVASYVISSISFFCFFLRAETLPLKLFPKDFLSLDFSSVLNINLSFLVILSPFSLPLIQGGAS